MKKLNKLEQTSYIQSNKDLILQQLLDFILNAIKKENDTRQTGNFIASDSTNKIMVNIYNDTMINSCLDIDLSGDELVLMQLFGYDQYKKIKDAESGIYHEMT